MSRVTPDAPAPNGDVPVGPVEPCAPAALTGARGFWISLGVGVVFFLLRVTRYDLALAGGITEFVLQLKFISQPELLAGEFVRGSVLALLSPASWTIAHMSRHLHLDAVTVEYTRLFLINVFGAVVIWSLAWTLLREPRTALVAVVLTVGGGMGSRGLSFEWDIGNYAEWHHVGLLLGLSVVVLVLSDRYVAAAAVVGVLLSVHPSHASISGALLVAGWLVREGVPRRSDLLAVGGVFLAAATPALVYLVATGPPLMRNGIDTDAWWELMRARKAWHLFPRSWGWLTWLNAALFVTAGLRARASSLARLPDDPARRRRERTVVTLLSVSGLLCGVAFIFTEIVPIGVVTRLTLFRASNYLEVVLALYLCDLVRRWLSSPSRQAVALAVLLASAMVWMELTVSVLLTFVLAGGLSMRYATRGKDGAHGGARSLAAIAAAVIVAVTTVHVFVEARPSLVRPSSDVALLAAWKDVQQWARAATPRTATFLTPPRLCGFETFSDRAAIMSICDIGRSVYAPEMASEEIRRLRAYGGPGPLSEQYFTALGPHYQGLDGHGLAALGRAFGATYAIVSKPTGVMLPRVYENARFAVFRMADRPSDASID
ncbi:MAG: hypothetical protein HY701_04450 [Gemmatimonadetes bacterium]|nr:hypothetical protein [Gemmatimonadota bacterium]